ncbi:MAG: 23S rRNA (adenine(2503)-C(2))-methyltransferase RlmN [Lentisphaeria bacterium]|nr:23S rRNA (adenine(2503)-C(2))-methyltransferase RlmN [Lentisphaeria bacterium]
MATSNNKLCSMNQEQLTEYLAGIGEKKFRVKQIMDWIYRKLELEPHRMENLSLALREKLAEELAVNPMTICRREADDSGTVKLLLRLCDGESIEMVIIPGGDGRKTFCLSTQVGCPVQCVFCASGRNGLTRNLHGGEIIEEFLLGCRELGGVLPDNIVFMGIGEGLLNYDNLIMALERLTGADYFGMSPRRITISSSGYVPNMLKLADLGREYNFALSLHATDDQCRRRIIPEKIIKYTIAEILAALKYYSEKVGRIPTLEYTLLAGINDSPRQAAELAAIAREVHAKINLIPYNPTVDGYARPERKVIEEFCRILAKQHAAYTLRQERGSGVNAACGQLRQQQDLS